MAQKNTVTNKIIELSNELPDCCSSFLLESGTEYSAKTRLAYAYELSWFFDYLISYHPHFAELKKQQIQIADLYQIKTTDINRYISKLSETLESKTVARKKSAISSFFTYLSSGTGAPLNFNPVLGSKRVKIPEKDTVIYLTMNEQEKLINCVTYGSGLSKNQLAYHERYQKRDLALIMLLLDTGIRVSELYGIDIKDVDFDECSVIVYRKRNKIQTVYFSDDTKTLIEDYLCEKRNKYPLLGSEEPLFTTLQGERLSVRSVEALVKKYAKASLASKAALTSPHKLRASFAMGYYDATGHDLLATQKALGHSTITATNVYAKAQNETLKNNRDLLSQKRKQQKGEKDV